MDFPVTQANAGKAAQTNVVTVRENIEFLVIGVGRDYWEKVGRIDIYLAVVDKFLTRLTNVGHQIMFWEKRLLGILNKEKWLYAK